MDAITDEVKATAKEYGINMIVSECVLDPYKTMNMIIVAVDKKTQEGWYMDTGNKNKISLYAHGCRMIKELFNKQA